MPFDIYSLSKKFKISPKSLNGAIQGLVHLGIINIDEEIRDKDFVKMALDANRIRNLQLGEIDREIVFDLMRSYDQIWVDWVEIDLDRWVKMTKKSIVEIKKSFLSLARQNIIKYYHQPMGTKLQFLRNRLSQQDFQDYSSRFYRLKERRELRSQGIIGLVQSMKCRSMVMLDYFGEKSQGQCGHCDNCLSSLHFKKGTLTLHEFTEPQIEELIFHAKLRSDSDTLNYIYRCHQEGSIIIPQYLLGFL